MSNTLLTSTKITREALRILHQKLNFVGSIDRQYDSQFAREGAKIGDTLKIRKPNEYTVRTGKVLDTQDTVEETIDLKIQTQKGVDLNFTSVDLTLSLDDFSDRILDPAISKLAAVIEADALTMFKDVWNQVADIGQALDYIDILNGRKILQDCLAPTSNRTALLNSQDQVDVIDDVKTLFNDQKQLSRQYREGYMGRAIGFDFAESTLFPVFVTGSDDGTGDYLTDVASSEPDGTGTGELNIDTGAGSFVRGDIITIEGVNRVHPETKADTGVPQQFVVTANATPGAGGGSIFISPAIVATGARQNVSNVPADGKKITKVGGASADHGISLLYQKEAFTFATADLVMPKGVDFGSRENFEGISLRIVRDYDINNDNLPCRLDVLYGYKALRPEWACRLAFN